MSLMGETRYGIEDLARHGGVTRRTVRYYVQQGLLPAPLGKGRGDHYGPDHLERLRAVKALQERGLALDEVRRELARPAGRRRAMAAAPAFAADLGIAADLAVASGSTVLEAPAALSAWRRIELIPGVELHVSAARRLPSPARLRELAEWCERNFGG